MRDPADAAIVEGLRRGDEAAFRAAYAKYADRIHGFLLRLSRRREIAEELAQETWLKLATTATRLDEDSDLAAWLYTVARNRWVSHRRWSLLDLSRFVAADDALSAAMADSASGEDARLDARRDLVAVEAALGRLAAAHREVLVLVAIEQVDSETAARVLGINALALRQRLSRARAELSRRLTRGHTGFPGRAREARPNSHAAVDAGRGVKDHGGGTS